MSNVNNSIHSKNNHHKHFSWSHRARLRLANEKRKATAKAQKAAYDQRLHSAHQKVFQNSYILSRIIELSDSPKNTAKNLRTVNKAFRQASIHTQRGLSIKSFSAQDLLEAFSEDLKTRNNSPLGNYLQKGLQDSPLPDIDITLSPEDLNNDDILSALRKLQSSGKTSPIKAVIELKNPSKIQSLINTQLTLLQENSSLFRAIIIKEEVSTSQLQNELATRAQKLQYTTGTPLTPTIKHFPLRISLTIPTINEFLITDFSTLPKNLQISQSTIDNSSASWLKETLTNAQSSQFQQQLNNLKHVTSLKLQIEIAADATVTIPSSVTTLSTCNIDGTLQFAPGSQCSTLSLGQILPKATVTIPASVTTLSTNGIEGTLQFAPGSQRSTLSLGNIYSQATLTVPASVTTLTTGYIEGTLQFAPGSQCSTLSLGFIAFTATVTIPSSVTSLPAGDISGTLNFAPGSQCSSLSLGSIFPHATVTIPPSVTTVTIRKTTYTGQSLLDLKSGKTSLPNVTFGQQ